MPRKPMAAARSIEMGIKRTQKGLKEKSKVTKLVKEKVEINILLGYFGHDRQRGEEKMGIFQEKRKI